DEAWIAGPSAIGSVNGIPSSITSAPAFGSALMSASEVSPSGSPAVRKVTSAARPCAFSSAKRISIRVVMIGFSLRPALAPLCSPSSEANVHSADHQHDDRDDELKPFLPFEHRPGAEQAHLEEIKDEGGRDGHQYPARDFLPIEHARSKHKAQSSAVLLQI